MTPFGWYLLGSAVVSATSGLLGWYASGWLNRRAFDPAENAFGAPRRCRWFGHDWQKGSQALGGPVLYCARPECLAQLRWPPAPPPPVRPLASGFVVGRVAETVEAGQLVRVELSPEICGKPPPDGQGGPG